MRLLDEIKNDPELKHLWIDRNKIMKSVGFDLDDMSFLYISQYSISELDELKLKSLMWQEYVSEVLATTDKMCRDQEAIAEEVSAEVVKSIMAQNTEYKVTEAKAYAKTHRDVKAATRRYNTLKAYNAYLARLMDGLSMYHYTIKSHVDALQNAERKYKTLRQ